MFGITDDEEFVIDLLRAKKILVTHGTGFNWFEPDHFRLVTLPDVDRSPRRSAGSRSSCETPRAGDATGRAGAYDRGAMGRRVERD